MSGETRALKFCPVYPQLFTTDGGHLDDSDEGNDDLSDSEESVFSGLEDSGSEDEADVNENGKSEAESSETSTKTAGKPQVYFIIFREHLLIRIFSVFNSMMDFLSWVRYFSSPVLSLSHDGYRLQSEGMNRGLI